MQREVGNKNFPIWLLGDSNPKNWETSLNTPLDPRHPVRHNIWTSVLDVIQEKAFKDCRSRVDTSTLYIRNAVENPALRPRPGDIEWSIEVEQEIGILRQLIDQNNPRLLLCFGRFSFEFARRAISEKPKRKCDYWRVETLGEEFRQRISDFNLQNTNLLPLLHRSISGGKFMESHKYFCGQDHENYFDFVGKQLADKLLHYKSELPIWIE